ncbi:type I-E CRISPR-associated protein Cse2/CasB [Hydrogenibacillus schlegelii]|uniref:CRISPR-associated protein, Cse2 family n=1 Tax=Hydrogenibacillus schlegelii TaxID=1484 RepID=A0A132MHA6_HYDSH|nr:type I-E CRISPR-associated protein Cse2/CasB [Hydrogenibacillus schlegelii]KWW97232.1 hypothetical protein TR75_09595 [Hydrogenibacillus schlegelii]OAR04282.1 hypothetical protein SA87_07370 [Hydrogenibacillus schlegelii]
MSSTLQRHIERLARHIGDDAFPTGDRAALRRMTPTQPPPLAFYHLAIQILPEDWDADLERRKDWQTLVAGMALMHPRIHEPRRGLGYALGDAKYSDLRLERLLAARGDGRRLLFLRAVRFLAAKGQAFDWTEAARFLLTRDAERREDIHRQVAKDYYRAVNESQREKATNL